MDSRDKSASGSKSTFGLEKPNQGLKKAEKVKHSIKPRARSQRR
jgi:hypothetical protein